MTQRTWYALQMRSPRHDWEDLMSLAGFHDPDLRKQSLETYRAAPYSYEIHPPPEGAEYRMVKYTEEVLDE
jgi:hypothetical protein